MNTGHPTVQTDRHLTVRTREKVFAAIKVFAVGKEVAVIKMVSVGKGDAVLKAVAAGKEVASIGDQQRK